MIVSIVPIGVARNMGCESLMTTDLPFFNSQGLIHNLGVDIGSTFQYQYVLSSYQCTIRTICGGSLGGPTQSTGVILSSSLTRLFLSVTIFDPIDDAEAKQPNNRIMAQFLYIA